MSAPLEALAFNYLSFGLFTVVNNIWTWVAVITAAFSFWRIKTSSTLLKPDTVHSGDDASLFPLQTPFVPSAEQVESVPVNNEPPSTSTTSMSFGRTKGRFTAYFEQDDIVGPCVDHYNCGDHKGHIDKFKIVSQWIQNGTFSSNGIEEEELCELKWYENWKKVIRTKTGEMGWYNHQDLMLIDGNIVRLWDGCRRRRETKTTKFWVGVVKTW